VGILDKVVDFVTGGLPTEIAKQVGDYVRGKGENELKKFLGDLDYDKTQLEVTSNDPLHTRQVIALTFHFFMWATLLIRGHFPLDVIFVYGTTQITVGAIYVLMLLFYFPFRSIEKWRNAFKGTP
jgi:hypothetical protein